MDAKQLTKLTRKIYSNSRIELEFFMYLPTLLMPKSNVDYALVSLNPILNIRYKPNKNIAQEFDYKKATYRVTPRNLYSTIKFFNTIMTWFYNDEYSDLYLVNDDQKLIFNADFNKLNVSTERNDFDQCLMQAIPTIVNFGDKEYEGINLYINTSNYQVPLSYQEISCIFSIIKDFSFQMEVNSTLLSYQYALQANRINIGNQFYEPNKKTPFDL